LLVDPVDLSVDPDESLVEQVEPPVMQGGLHVVLARPHDGRVEDPAEHGDLLDAQSRALSRIYVLRRKQNEKSRGPTAENALLTDLRL
jgi:hypothetical protein